MQWLWTYDGSNLCDRLQNAARASIDWQMTGSWDGACISGHEMCRDRCRNRCKLKRDRNLSSPPCFGNKHATSILPFENNFASLVIYGCGGWSNVTLCNDGIMKMILWWMVVGMWLPTTTFHKRKLSSWCRGKSLSNTLLTTNKSSRGLYGFYTCLGRGIHSKTSEGIMAILDWRPERGECPGMRRRGESPVGGKWRMQRWWRWRGRRGECWGRKLPGKGRNWREKQHRRRRGSDRAGSVLACVKTFRLAVTVDAVVAKGVCGCGRVNADEGRRGSSNDLLVFDGPLQRLTQLVELPRGSRRLLLGFLL